MGMLHTAEIDMNDTVSEEHISDFIADAFWLFRYTYHKVLKASPGADFLEGTCYLTFHISPTGTK